MWVRNGLVQGYFGKQIPTMFTISYVIFDRLRVVRAVAARLLGEPTARSDPCVIAAVCWL